MKRLHLIEIEDQPWFPSSMRDAVTDYLQFVIALGRPYAPVVPRLLDALKQAQAYRVIDLCSGGGGPWPTLLPLVSEPITVCLTDKFPNVRAFQFLQASADSRLGYHLESVDATAVPPDLGEFRTLFSSFHHFTPEQAHAVLQDATARGHGIGIFEATHRSLPAIVAMFMTPLLVLIFTPFFRPFRLSRLLWTYMVPVVPLVVLFDGIVSCLRTYSPAELQSLVAGLPPSASNYHWEIGEARENRGMPVTYLLGYPHSNQSP